jgi:hypothetical protein
MLAHQLLLQAPLSDNGFTVLALLTSLLHPLASSLVLPQLYSTLSKQLEILAAHQPSFEALVFELFNFFALLYAAAPSSQERLTLFDS